MNQTGISSLGSSSLKRKLSTSSSSSTETPIEETKTLNQLHEEMMAATDSEKLLDYLMDSMQYLKHDDLVGWKAKFQPEPILPAKKQKRLRQSPAAAPIIPFEPCLECKSDQILDDVREGQVVCLSCGLIQTRVVFTADFAHCTYDQIRNTARVAIHRYSRVVHFLNVIRLLTGDSSPVIDDVTMNSLLLEVGGEKTFESVIRGLRKLGACVKYRKHAWRLVLMCGGACPYKFDAQDVMLMVKMFRIVEFWWEKKRWRVFPERKVFFSYKFLLFQFLHALKLPAPTDLLLKSPGLHKKQVSAYEGLSPYTLLPVCKEYAKKREENASKKKTPGGHRPNTAHRSASRCSQVSPRSTEVGR
jgi:transcription initiation factor TFIIIB Brf1 subunit/transcription initiation factor TFIIB